MGGVREVKGTWVRIGVMTRVLLEPARKERNALRRSLILSASPSSSPMIDDMNNEDLEGKDVARDIADAIGKYAPALLTAVSKDMTEREDNLSLRGIEPSSPIKDLSEEPLVNQDDCRNGDFRIQGEVRVLREAYKIISYSDAILGTCVEVLLKHRIVKSLSVLRWVLGDDDCSVHKGVELRKNGNGKEGDILDHDSKKYEDKVFEITPTWWNLASLAVRFDVADAVGVRGDNFDSTGSRDSAIGFVIDNSPVTQKDGSSSLDGGDVTAFPTVVAAITPTISRMKLVTDRIVPLVRYAYGRVLWLIALERKRNAVINSSEEKKQMGEEQKHFQRGRKKLCATEVDLAEGLKQFILAAEAHVAYTLKNDEVVLSTAEDGDNFDSSGSRDSAIGFVIDNSPVTQKDGSSSLDGGDVIAFPTVVAAITPTISRMKLVTDRIVPLVRYAYGRVLWLIALERK